VYHDSGLTTRWSQEATFEDLTSLCHGSFSLFNSVLQHSRLGLQTMQQTSVRVCGWFHCVFHQRSPSMPKLCDPLCEINPSASFVDFLLLLFPGLRPISFIGFIFRIVIKLSCSSLKSCVEVGVFLPDFGVLPEIWEIKHVSQNLYTATSL